MNDRRILKISLIIGMGLLPIIFRKPSYKTWSMILFSNMATSCLMNIFLVKTNRLEYPVRLAPKICKISIIYDFIVCPLFTIVYCQSSYNSKLISTILQGILYAIPQTAIEYFAEQKTKLIKYKNGWTWKHSFLGIIAIKFSFRGLLELVKPKSKLVSSKSQSEIDHNP